MPSHVRSPRCVVAAFYRDVLTTGGTVENHSWSHTAYTTLSDARLDDELCRTNDLLAQVFGRRPLLARPPFGAVNERVERAMARCGIHVNVMWNVEIDSGTTTYSDRGGSTGMQPGDIVLLHWGPSLLGDLRTAFAEMDRRGLRAAPLQDYVGPTARPAGSSPPEVESSS
jgi:peptidoglycan/xylan/chitin deacetylase (PgdA/CDA1 family)